MTLPLLLNRLAVAHQEVQQLGKALAHKPDHAGDLIVALDALELAETALRNYVEAGQE